MAGWDWFLTDRSCSISTFSNAGDALKHILDAGTDILVTDHGMGSMTGADLIRKLRDRGSQTPIIMISGDPQAEAEGRAAGANQFLHKHSDVNELEHHIRRLPASLVSPQPPQFPLRNHSRLRRHPIRKTIRRSTWGIHLTSAFLFTPYKRGSHPLTCM